MSLTTLVKQIFGSRNQRLLKQYRKVVEKINQFEKPLEALSDEQLRAKTAEFKQRLLEKHDTLDTLLPEAFAVVREASKRTLGLRHFDVQMIGGMVLHAGKIAEMGTGEGKTLVATLPAYLNALTGDGVHIVTVNDYLAKRDAEWMEPIYNFLGLTVGVNLTMMDPVSKRAAFAADITYGTNNEFGFDYLRDNMAFAMTDRVQRKLQMAIVDEVDSILIDEARTPLIISGPSEDSSEWYIKINRLIPFLHKQEKDSNTGDYVLDEKNRQAHLTEDGHQKIEELLVKEGILGEGESLYAPANIVLMHHVLAALRAHTLFQRDVHYIVKNNEVIIVDEHTGRTLPGRRWSEGLHQAVEAKEGAHIQNENQTLASITFQNYFRLYDKLAGMTGTADTEAYEFQQIYGLEVVVMPTNRVSQRLDHSDKVFITKKEKFAAVIADIRDCVKRSQPILVGTASIETSEFLSHLLKKENIAHQVLNAKFHQKEAEIIAEAGRPGAVTIATNMAGRGTDIVLGGNPETELNALENPTEEDRLRIKTAWRERHEKVLQAGGLHVIGSERHESRRIDNQLRGRCGRQGDPGSSRFYLSLEDDLLRIFAADRVANLMRRLGLPEGEAIEHPWVSRSIETAQRKVEAHNFDIRKELLEFDDVANAQRKVIYTQRSEIMASDNLSAMVQVIMEDVVNNIINTAIPQDSMEEVWDIEGLTQQLSNDFGVTLAIATWLQSDEAISEENLRQRILEAFKESYHAKEQQLGAPVLRHFEKVVLLQSLDSHWKDHLAAMDYLRQGIYLRGYAQKNPKQEYKREAFQLFGTMLETLKQSVISILMTARIQAEEDVAALEAQREKSNQQQSWNFQHTAPQQVENPDEMTAGNEESDAAPTASGKILPFTRETPKVGRNDPCPCGSGKKYKHCHGVVN